MKKLLLFGFLLAFMASTGSYAQNEQRTRHIGYEKFRALIENYKPSGNQGGIANPSRDGVVYFSEDFNEVGLDLPAGWTKVGSSEFCTWKMDATPGLPGFYSAGGSLNFNNGTDFDCDEGDGYGTWGTVTSPSILVSGQPCYISFMFNLQNECNGGEGGGGPAAAPLICGYDDTFMVILDENGNELTAYFVDGSSSWNLNSYYFDNPGGLQNIRIAFYFDSGDYIANQYYGPFIDDLQVTQNAVATPVAGWAIALGIFLITVFTIFRIRRQA